MGAEAMTGVDQAMLQLNDRQLMATVAERADVAVASLSVVTVAE